MSINHLNKENILRLIRACSSIKIYEKAHESLELGIHGKVITKINYNFSSSPKDVPYYQLYDIRDVLQECSKFNTESIDYFEGKSKVWSIVDNQYMDENEKYQLLIEPEERFTSENTNVLEKELLLILIRACEAENKIGESVTNFLQKIIYEPAEIIPFEGLDFIYNTSLRDVIQDCSKYAAPFNTLIYEKNSTTVGNILNDNSLSTEEKYYLLVD